jgi:large subunit ribosomal protein L18
LINQKTNNQRLRLKRAQRVRKHLRGTSVKPRLCVVKTNKHIQAQLIDDELGVTIGSVSTCCNKLKDTEFNKKNIASARHMGEHIAEIAKSKNIKEVIFDRGASKYHGILAELANTARSNGLLF